MNSDRTGIACLICGIPISIGDASYSWVLNEEAYVDGAIDVNHSEGLFCTCLACKERYVIADRLQRGLASHFELNHLEIPKRSEIEAVSSEFTCDICLRDIPDTLEFISLSHYTELHEPNDVIQPLFGEWSLISCTACAKEKDLTGVVKQLGENVEGQLRRVST